MPTKPLDHSISEALMQFFAANDIEVESAPPHLVEAIREDVEPVIQKYKLGLIDHKDVGKAIWETSMYVLRDMTDEEIKEYASLMYGAIGSHGHLDK